MQDKETALITERLSAVTNLPQHVLTVESSEESPLSSALSVVFRYRLLVILISISCSIGFAIWTVHYRPKLYFATTLVNIGTYTPPLDGPISKSLRDESKSKSFVNTQVPLLKSFKIASLVLRDNPAIRDFLSSQHRIEVSAEEVGGSADSGSRPTRGESAFPADLLETYLAHISYSLVKDTPVISINATARSPDMAAMMANAHGEALIALVREQRLRSAKVNLDFLTNRLRETRARFGEAEKKLNDYIKANPLILAYQGGGSDLGGDKTQKLYSLLTSATVERSRNEARAREMASVTGRNGAFKGGNDRVIAQFLELSALEGEYEYFRRLGANRFYLDKLRREIEISRGALRQYQKKNAYDARVELDTSRNVENLLRGEIAKSSERDLEAAKLRGEYNILVQQRDQAKDLLDQVSARFEDAVVNAENDQKHSVILDPAIPPTRAIGDDVYLALLIGLGGGIVIGVVLAFLIDFLKDSVHSIGDLQRIRGISVLGVVPKFSREFLREIAAARRSRAKEKAGRRVSAKDSHTKRTQMLAGCDDLTRSYTHLDENGMELPGDLDRCVASSAAELGALMGSCSRESEAFRALLATVRYQPNGLQAPKTILITSGQKGEGKTTMAINLAIASAESSRRTLIIDTDLRLPKVQDFFGLPPETAGLVNYLTGNADYSDLIVDFGADNLAVIVAGGQTATPGILLQSSRMTQLLDLLKDEFDQIIIDSPPVMRAADALMLAPHVDGVVVVTRSGATPRAVANSTIVGLKQVGANVMGTVLNGVTKASHYGGVEYHVGRGYGY